jgi:hypothetical protein
MTHLHWSGRAPTETDFVQLVLDYLRRCGIHAWRQNSGQRGRLRFGTPGCGDITGILPGGRRLEIECKTVEGVQSGAQAAFQAIIEQHGGCYILARRLEDVEPVIQEARRRKHD